MVLLPPAEIRRRLAALDGWRREGRRIVKDYGFKTYLDGIRFVTRVARLAERRNHHPDIAVGWCKVTLSITTHDAGGLTERDFGLAEAVDGIRFG